LDWFAPVGLRCLADLLRRSEIKIELHKVECTDAAHISVAIFMLFIWTLAVFMYFFDYTFSGLAGNVLLSIDHCLVGVFYFCCDCSEALIY